MATANKLCNKATIEMTDRRATNLESNLIKSETIKRTLEGLVNDHHHNNHNNSASKDEKVDVSPEINNKSPNTNGGSMNKSFSMYTFGAKDDEEEPADDNGESPSKTIDPSKATAFVIDFSGGKQVSEQRHKHMLERFQNRHRRGVSLSKVEDEMNDSSSSSQLTAKLKSSPAASAKQQRKLSTSSTSQEVSAPQPAKPSSAGVRLRERSKTSQVRDANKRHSWSPRTSIVESVQQHNQQPKLRSKPAKASQHHQQQVNPLERPLKLHALSRADVKPLPPTTLNITTLQCLQTPLESHRTQQDDQVSEAGTYTLDGDNYTEEQKAKMNIDNLALEADALLLRTKLEINESDSNVETDLEVIDLDPSPSRSPHIAAARHSSANNSSKVSAASRKNILEVSFYHHEQPPASAGSSKSKSSYLDKLKTKVKSSLHKAKSPESDVGKFTSVTTSGVLSVKPTLELNPKLKRKNSLTKSQIDSSEYIQGRSRREQKVAAAAPVTDSDKSSIASAYQLNIFPTSQQSPAKSRKESVGSSSTSISTAATKDDWIQEWARNAREYSQHSGKRAPHTVMSSSFNIENSRETRDDQFGYLVDDVMSRSDCKPHYDEFGDNLERYHQKTHHRKKSSDANNLNSAHSSVSSARGRKILRELDPHKDDMRQHSLPSSNFNIKPPMSPCRIPSPIGTVSHRKKRYGSSAMLYGSDTDLANDTDLYLQRTAAAISTLQNIQRRNSLRNASLQNSPVSPLSPTRPPISVQPSRPATAVNNAMRSQSATRSAAIHKRNSSLDSTRYAPNNSQSSVSTSLQTNHHLAQAIATEKQQQSPYNSYEGMPQRNSKFSLQFDQTDDDDEYESMPRRTRPLSERPHQSIKQQQHSKQQQQQLQHKASPIKRSSSFNMRPTEISSPVRASTAPQHKVNNNQFTKPFSAPPNGSRIQKSASSSCFSNKQVTRQSADDEDYESEFYINDDDDLNPNQFTPSDCSEDEQKLSLPSDTAPLQTRYVNKTFLMRCEQTKKATNATNAGGLKAIGAVACPNTPEMPRRNVAERTSARDRSSMHRDLSLSRLQEKKATLSTNSTPTAKATTVNAAAAAASTKVTSKYLDISKYKSDKGGNFLKRDESKNYLNREVKKSSSSACLQSFQRDNTRTSQRSSSSRPSSATTASGKKKEVKNSKELELAMWKRRASYDPLKAAAEGKKKAEEVKRMIQQKMVMSTDSNSSAMRSSKSFHAGTANTWIDNESDSEYDDDN